MKRKVIMILAILLAIGMTLTAVSAEDSWSFNFSSEENSDGGSINFENGKLTIQGIEFTIPDGYEMDESSKKVAEDAEDFDAKYSACKFTKGDDEIVVNVFFTDGDFENLSANNADQVEKTLNDIKGLYEENKYGDNTPTFTYIEDGKVVKINAPNDEIIESVMGK